MGQPPFRPLSSAVGLTAAGVGALIGVGSAALVTLQRQARIATRLIEQAAIEAAIAEGQLPDGVLDPRQVQPPRGDGVYLPDGRRLEPAAVPPGMLTLTVLGDSTAVGYGTRTIDELPGVMLARGVAAALDRPVRLTCHGVIGSVTADLDGQIDRALPDRPDVVVVVSGGNDVKDTVPPQRSAANFGAAVLRLRTAGIPVVAGTCPDFGVIAPIPQPLRSLLRAWSRYLAELQERAVIQAGGVPVAIGRLVSPEFADHPELFSPDRFHPSGAGYARAVAALLPAVLEVLDGRIDEHPDAPASPHPLQA